MVVFGVNAGPGRRVEGADPTEYLFEISNRSCLFRHRSAPVSRVELRLPAFLLVDGRGELDHVSAYRRCRGVLRNVTA